MMKEAQSGKKEFIPQFVAVGDYSIQDRISGKLFDCRKSNQVRGACDLYKFYTDPSEINDTVVFIDHLFYQRVCEYLIKNKYPHLPNPFDDYNVSISQIKGVKKALPPDYIYSNDTAKIIVKLFTSDDINIAIKRCRITGKAHERYKEEFIKLVKSRKQVNINKNSDLFNKETKTSNNKDDSLYSTLFCGIDKSDFIKLREHCKLIRNIVHLYTCNNIEFERLLSETEKATNNYLLEKAKQEIKSCLDTETSPERIKEILKFIKGNK